MAHSTNYASGNATEHSETHIPVVTLEVLWLSGTQLCQVDLKPDGDNLRGVKNYIANLAGYCACRLIFIAKGDVAQEGLVLNRWIKNQTK